eukprot:IDg16997t1
MCRKVEEGICRAKVLTENARSARVKTARYMRPPTIARYIVLSLALSGSSPSRIDVNVLFEYGRGV